MAKTKNGLKSKRLDPPDPLATEATLRDHFAIQAFRMVGDSRSPEAIADSAYKIADAMMDRREEFPDDIPADAE